MKILKLKSHLKVYLQVWFAMKLTKINLLQRLSPEEVVSTDGKTFFKKNNSSEKAIVGPVGRCQNQKTHQKKLLIIMELMQ